MVRYEMAHRDTGGWMYWSIVGWADRVCSIHVGIGEAILWRSALRVERPGGVD